MQNINCILRHVVVAARAFDNSQNIYYHFHSRQTFANIHKLLRPNGVAIINFLIETPLFDIYERLSKFKKYREYMKDVKQFISPYHHEDRPLELVKKYCTNAGFIINHMEIREKIYFYRDEHQLKGKRIDVILQDNETFPCFLLSSEA